MTLRLTAGGLGRLRIRTALAVLLGMICLGAAATEAAAAPWTQVTRPWTASRGVNDVYAFGTTGLAVAGDDGNIAVTRDGGHSWSVAVPGGLSTAVFTAIAVDTAGRGVVASGGLLLVRPGWTSTWRRPVYDGPGPGAAINDIALQGSRGVAVGDDGVIMTSDDAGATWRRLDSPTTSSITSVAIAGDGKAVAGSSAGEILVGTADTWTLAGTVAGRVTSVAAARTPVWGDGQPDLFAATGSDVVGSDNALAFASLPGLPNLGSQAWPFLAWAGLPDRSLLIAGANQAGFFSSPSQVWVSGSSGASSTAGAAAPAGQSVAYLLAADGRLLRTLSAGRTPADIKLSSTRILVGASVRVTAAGRVAAPGTLLVRERVPGRSWGTARTFSWVSGDWNRSLSFLLAPTLTREYRLDFKYGSTVTVLTPVVKVVVTPKITTARSSFSLRRGDVFRFSGTVTPTLSGESVGLYTDRGGSWRPITVQPSVKLVNGRTWTSRQFGTPKAETYHLRAHLAATSKHGSAWSRVVTVTIR